MWDITSTPMKWEVSDPCKRISVTYKTKEHKIKVRKVRRAQWYMEYIAY